ncbi:hypothetical protein RND81_05G251800 [Saponaria officinalis]|uniref:Transcription factor CBF/NF-Y/archaeal histone domain-containing protein n=1 Tax=Saponaria officinalis TaxID=3572 RepID=A0AAW1L0Q6_SAPOF
MRKDKATAAAVADAEELPRTIVRRVVKDKLSEVSGDGGDVILHKEALIAFSESARIFIHYLSATAHDICSESRRQIINADDVLNALDEIEFSEFVEPLREALDEFRKKAAGKRAGAAKAKDDNKKRKTETDTTSEKGGDEGQENNVENGDEVENQVNGDRDDEVEEQASGDNEDETEEQVSGDNEDEDEEQASGNNEEEEQASGDEEDEVEAQASGDEDEEVGEQSSEE